MCCTSFTFLLYIQDSLLSLLLTQKHTYLSFSPLHSLGAACVWMFVAALWGELLSAESCRSQEVSMSLLSHLFRWGGWTKRCLHLPRKDICLNKDFTLCCSRLLCDDSLLNWQLSLRVFSGKKGTHHFPHPRHLISTVLVLNEELHCWDIIMRSSSLKHL